MLTILIRKPSRMDKLNLYYKYHVFLTASFNQMFLHPAARWERPVVNGHHCSWAIASGRRSRHDYGDIDADGGEMKD